MPAAAAIGNAQVAVQQGDQAAVPAGLPGEAGQIAAAVKLHSLKAVRTAVTPTAVLAAAVTVTQQKSGVQAAAVLGAAVQAAAVSAILQRAGAQTADLLALAVQTAAVPDAAAAQAAVVWATAVTAGQRKPGVQAAAVLGAAVQAAGSHVAGAAAVRPAAQGAVMDGAGWGPADEGAGTEHGW